ncbi:MAG: hypothetical protein QOE51_2472 [Actinoplanes sp.]|nr:hypothetical protein [Actinoplanes sp.]
MCPTRGFSATLLNPTLMRPTTALAAQPRRPLVQSTHFQPHRIIEREHRADLHQRIHAGCPSARRYQLGQALLP